MLLTFTPIYFNMVTTLCTCTLLDLRTKETCRGRYHRHSGNRSNVWIRTQRIPRDARRLDRFITAARSL